MNDWLDAEQRIERAQQLSECHRWEEALAELDAALAINPENALWNAQRGYLLEELDRDEEAVAAYQRSHDLDSSDNEVALALGAALARLDRLSSSLEVLEALALRDPNFEPAYCNRIRLYSDLGRHEQAEEVFYLAQQFNDKCPDCFFHLGESLAARAQFDRAIFCWERVLGIAPDYLGVNRRIGEAYRAKGQLQLAREFLLRELREDSGNTELLFSLAELSWEAGDPSGAVTKLEHLLELEPDHAKGRWLLGRIRLRNGEPQRALAEFEQIKESPDGEPTRFELNCSMGEALLRLGCFADARARLEAPGDNDSKDLRRLVLLGDADLALDRPADAADCYRRILASEARNPFVHHRLAVCLLKTNKPEAALQHCQAAIEENPEFVQAMYHAALAHVRLGQFRAAKEWVKRALRVAPDDAAVQRLSDRLWRLRFRHYLGWLWR